MGIAEGDVGTGGRRDSGLRFTNMLSGWMGFIRECFGGGGSNGARAWTGTDSRPTAERCNKPCCCESGVWADTGGTVLGATD